MLTRLDSEGKSYSRVSTDEVGEWEGTHYATTSCMLHMAAYSPLASISVSCVPDSATYPSLSTMMISIGLAAY